MNPPDVAFAVVGFVALLAAVLPRLLEGRPLSLPLVLLSIGALVPLVLPVRFDPLNHPELAERLTEVTVLVALMGAGLRLDRPFSLRRWSATWRLLGVTMPLTVGVGTLLAWWLLGLPVAAALLVGAALAPTDPVLASEVQVAGPLAGEDEDDEVRFALTSEAGLNDALAFPFVHLSLLVAAGATFGDVLVEWSFRDVVYRLSVALLVGLVVGWALGRLAFGSRLQVLRLSEHNEGFVALAGTFVAYGLTQLVHGYGFLAVFVAALTLRSSERGHGYHRVLHDFTEQVERLLTVLVLLLLGASLVTSLRPEVSLEVVLFAVLALLVRPLLALPFLSGTHNSLPERAVTAFFGVRGVGSLYYLAFGVLAFPYDDARLMWAAVAMVVALSVLVHGVSAGPSMAALDRYRSGGEPRSPAGNGSTRGP